MKRSYPIVMTKGEKHIVVYIPDFNINTQGKNREDAIRMAQDAIGIVGIDMEDDGEELPKASSIQAVKSKAGAEDEVVLAEVDFTEYRRKWARKCAEM